MEEITNITMYVYLNVNGIKFPFLTSCQRGYVHTLRYIDALRHVTNILQRTLDTVKNRAQDAWTQLNRQRFAGTQHRIADSYARCFFVHLQRVNSRKPSYERCEPQPT